MAYRINTNHLNDLRKYGGDTVNKCFNCGNCSAVCCLTDNETVFPRKFIRYMQLGLTDKILESPDPWICYYCGECSETCPREAKPGELMAATRRWLIGHYDFTGLARTFYTSAPLSFLIMAILFVIIAAMMMTGSGTMHAEDIQLWQYLDPVIVHNIGLSVVIFVAIVGLLGIVNMVRHLAPRSSEKNGGPGFLQAFFKVVFKQVFGHKLYLECDEESDDPWHRQRWFVHGCVAWGFFGLLIATMTQWMLDLLGIKETGVWDPVYSIPIRFLGIVSGLFLMYGTTVWLKNRLTKKPDEMAANSTPSDWLFLMMLWVGGLTGFLVIVGRIFPTPQVWIYPMLLVHVVISMELVLLAPFTKFAHVFYRTYALILHEMRGGYETCRTAKPITL